MGKPKILVERTLGNKEILRKKYPVVGGKIIIKKGGLGKGDKGFTNLLFKGHISKDSPYIKAVGNLDELNSQLGLIKAKVRSRGEKDIIERIQRAIYVVSSEIAIGAEEKRKHGPILKKEDVDWAESVVYELEGKIKLKNYFYTPGENEFSAIIDIARTVARRAERSVVGLFKKEKIIVRVSHDG